MDELCTPLKIDLSTLFNIASYLGQASVSRFTRIYYKVHLLHTKAGSAMPKGGEARLPASYKIKTNPQRPVPLGKSFRRNTPKEKSNKKKNRRLMPPSFPSPSCQLET